MKEARRHAQPGLARTAYFLRAALLSALLGFSIFVCYGEDQAKPIEGKPLVHPGIGASDFQRELDIHVQKTEAPAAEPEPDSTSSLTLLLLGVALIPGVILGWRKLGAFFREHFAPLESDAVISPQLNTSQAEEQFVNNFATVVQANAAATSEVARSRQDALDEFLKSAPDLLGALRNRFAEISRSSDESARQKTLASFCAEVGALKARLAAFELASAWQLASGLERLLNQLSEKAGYITPSTLRTAAGALIVLKDMCVPGVRADLATNPPFRFLAVDDDPISRRAVAMSLRKIAQAPDVAENGEAALEFAARQAYDAVFLDVEMPGLDGFEVCTRLHKLPTNQGTPVVFVTSHSDFDSRVKSTSSGGRDLIAKPFLSSEITLKALTLLLRGRLDRDNRARELSDKASTPAQPTTPSPAAKPKLKAAELPLLITDQETAQTEKNMSANSHPANSSATSNVQQSPSPGDFSSEPVLSATDYAEAFAEHSVAHLREMRKQVEALGLTEAPAERQEILGELYMGLNLLRSEAARGGLKSICEMASALGKLVAKLLDKPALFMPSALQAMEAAIRLLEELSPTGIEQDLTAPPVRVLVVDDDPFARRSISNALQLTFGKPDSAENGETAVALTESKVFDVIFLDIMMPDLDGFETCSKIRQTKLNGATPIVFVSSHKDTDSREKAAHSGGNGFITKPVLPAEIFLTALTFTMRARIEKSARVEKGNPAPPVEKLEAVLC